MLVSLKRQIKNALLIISEHCSMGYTLFLHFLSSLEGGFFDMKLNVTHKMNYC